MKCACVSEIMLGLMIELKRTQTNAGTNENYYENKNDLTERIEFDDVENGFMVDNRFPALFSF